MGKNKARRLELEEMARAEFILALPNGEVLQRSSLEEIYVRSIIAGGNVWPLRCFSGNIIIKPKGVKW